MHHDFDFWPRRLAGTKQFRLLQNKLFNGVLQDDLRVLHDMLRVQDAKVPLPEPLGATHARAAVSSVVEDDHVHSKDLGVEMHPFRLVLEVLVENGVGIAEEDEVRRLVVYVQLHEGIGIGPGSGTSRIDADVETGGALETQPGAS